MTQTRKAKAMKVSKIKPSKVYVLGEVTCREYADLDLVLRTHNGLTDAECISTGQWFNQSFLSVNAALDCALAVMKK